MKLVALHGPNASDQLEQLEMLSALQPPRGQLPASPPLLPLLLAPATAPPPTPLGLTYKASYKGVATPDVDAMLATTLERFRLNAEQQTVLEQLAEWLKADLGAAADRSRRPPCPVLLVHGVFGAGKSHLLVCALWFLQRALRGASRRGRPCKVPLAALSPPRLPSIST